MGAALAVLHGGAAPLRLSAAKSQYGHAESAAGSLGIARAAAQMVAGQISSITALININPYVASSFAMTSSVIKPYISRQIAGRSHVSMDEAVLSQAVGVSSFAFQGTNGHAVLAEAMVPVCHSVKALNWIWQRGRYWFTVPQHHMLHTCQNLSADVAEFSCKLNHVSSTFIQDHKVCITLAYLHSGLTCLAMTLLYVYFLQVQGRVLFPAAAMLDMLLGTAHHTCQPNVPQPMLLDSTISSPLLMALGTDVYLRPRVMLIRGHLELMSIAMTPCIHMSSLAGMRKS